MTGISKPSKNNSDSEGPVEFDMDMGEALERLAGTDTQEVSDVEKGNMSPETIEDLIDAFEARAQVTDEGEEFWYARDLQELFDYGEWRNFMRVIESAVRACEGSGHNSPDHFVESNKMVTLGSGAEREVQDFILSRYACYLTAQNSNAKKKPVAFAQTYFAIQTRRQELSDNKKSLPQTEDEKRILLRDEITKHNKYLSGAAKGAGIETPTEFAIFHSHGYKGLYGMTKKEIQRHKGLKSKDQILDRMGSTELAANFFRVTQTEEKLRQDGIKGKQAAYDTHYAVGRKVREAMLEISGIAPENLPVADDIKHAKKRIKEIQGKSKKLSAPAVEIAAELEAIDLRKDLWKYALLVIVQQPNMEMSTKDLIAELPNYITVPDEAVAANMSRKDSKFSQLVRNLKSHKTSKTNFIFQGYAQAIPSGFKATEKGLAFVRKNFS